MLLVSCGRCEDCFAESAIFIIYFDIENQKDWRPGKESWSTAKDQDQSWWTKRKLDGQIKQPQIDSLARKVQTRVQPARYVC